MQFQPAMFAHRPNVYDVCVQGCVFVFIQYTVATHTRAGTYLVLGEFWESVFLNAFPSSGVSYLFELSAWAATSESEWPMCVFIFAHFSFSFIFPHFLSFSEPKEGPYYVLDLPPN